jgi:hypothetical protein
LAIASALKKTGAQQQRHAGVLVLAYRIMPGQWKSDEQFARLLALLNRNRHAVDEISLFDETFPRPACRSLDQLEDIADRLKRRIAELRRSGFHSVGINVIYTIGHLDFAVGFPPMPVPPAVGHDGTVSNGCACLNHPEFRAYIKKRYALMARAKPDFIWVDDDMRMSHHGPTYPCFCSLCLERFGHGTDRVALVEQLNAPGNGDLRRAWTEFCAASLESLCADIRKAVTEMDPAIQLGQMTIGYSHSTYAGYPVHRCMTALRARRGRPGHGYYTDEVPRQLLNKSMDIGREIRDYPSAVETIEYELENYPYITLDKAARTVLNECTAALIMGCNGVAFNVLKECEGPLEDYERLLRAVGVERPIWEALREGAADLPLAGFWPADNRLLMANRRVDNTGWFWEGGVYDIQRPNPLAGVGLPLNPDPRSACGTLLAGKVAEAFSRDELRDMLRKGVLMDGLALQVLLSQGLGELAGVKPGKMLSGGVTERLTNHAFNGRYGGDGRDVLVGQVDGLFSLASVGEGVGDLAHLVFYDGTDGGCCFSVYRNSLGGRVAVATYSPWLHLGCAAMRHRLLAVADWLADGRLPVLIQEMVPVAPLLRCSPDGQRVALVLLNAGLEPSGPVTLHLRARPQQISLISVEGATPLRAQHNSKETVVDCPSIPAWQTAVLLGR